MEPSMGFSSKELGRSGIASVPFWNANRFNQGSMTDPICVFFSVFKDCRKKKQRLQNIGKYRETVWPTHILVKLQSSDGYWISLNDIYINKCPSAIRVYIYVYTHMYVLLYSVYICMYTLLYLYLCIILYIISLQHIVSTYWLECRDKYGQNFIPQPARFSWVLHHEPRCLLASEKPKNHHVP